MDKFEEVHDECTKWRKRADMGVMFSFVGCGAVFLGLFKSELWYVAFGFTTASLLTTILWIMPSWRKKINKLKELVEEYDKELKKEEAKV